MKPSILLSFLLITSLRCADNLSQTSESINDCFPSCEKTFGGSNGLKKPSGSGPEGSDGPGAGPGPSISTETGFDCLPSCAETLCPVHSAVYRVRIEVPDHGFATAVLEQHLRGAALDVPHVLVSPNKPAKTGDQGIVNTNTGSKHARWYYPIENISEREAIICKKFTPGGAVLFLDDIYNHNTKDCSAVVNASAPPIPCPHIQGTPICCADGSWQRSRDDRSPEVCDDHGGPGSGAGSVCTSICCDPTGQPGVSCFDQTHEDDCSRDPACDWIPNDPEGKCLPGADEGYLCCGDGTWQPHDGNGNAPSSCDSHGGAGTICTTTCCDASQLEQGDNCSSHTDKDKCYQDLACGWLPLGIGGACVPWSIQFEL